MSQNINEEIDVTIKLKKWQISRLVGAARLGIILEEWCAYLTMTGISCYDSESSRWGLSVASAIKQIQKQTTISEEDYCYGTDDGALEKIDRWIEEQCVANEKRWEEYHKKQIQEHSLEIEVNSSK